MSIGPPSQLSTQELPIEYCAPESDFSKNLTESYVGCIQRVAIPSDMRNFEGNRDALD